MPRILRNLRINEVSGVDRGAGEGVKILLMKRAEGEGLSTAQAQDIIEKISDAMRGGADEKLIGAAIAALDKSVGEIIADGKPAEREADLAASLKQFSDHLAGLTKEHADMTPEEIQKAIDAGVAKAVGTAVADAVKKALEPVSADLAKAQTEAAVAKLAPEHAAHYAKLADADKPAFLKLDAKAMSAEVEKAQPHSDPVVKAVLDENARLKKDAEDLAKRLATLEGDKTASAFEKRATDLGLTKEFGEVMQKAYSGDPLSQTKLDAEIARITKSNDELARLGGVFREVGTAHGRSGTAYDEITAKAAELVKNGEKNPTTGQVLTPAQAFTKIYESNGDLRERYKKEDAQRINKLALTGQ